MAEVREVGRVRGLGFVATARHSAGATILAEAPLWTISLAAVCQDAEFLKREDVQALVSAIAAGDAAELANDLQRLYAGHALTRLPDDVREKVWRLADSIRDARAGDQCFITEGVQDDEFAGRFGVVRAVAEDGSERAACTVTIDSEEHVLPRWRLKTARGLWRTNAVEDEGRGRVYERLSRVNHACGSANCERAFDGDRCALVATQSIRAGDELLLDYCSESERLLPPQTRRDRLFRAYGFACLCVACRAAYADYGVPTGSGDDSRSVRTV